MTLEEFKDKPDIRQRRETPTAARVEQVTTPPAITPNLTRRAAFIARNEGKTEQSTDQVTAYDLTGATVHSRPGTVVMYKPTERMGYQPRTVSVSAMPMLFKQGWEEMCPHCGGHHVDRNGKPTNDPNACVAAEPKAVRECPVCRKRVYDNMSLMEATEGEDDDPNVIRDDAYMNSTPAVRTKLKLDLHLWIRHAEWAQANGVAPLPTAFREMVDGAPQSRGT